MTLEMALKEQFQAGKQEGREEGLAEGEAKGLAKGETKGKAKGLSDSLKIIRDLKNGNSVEQIAQKYQIDIEKVQAFQECL